MINKNKWIDSLPISIKKFDDNNNQLDHHRWVNTISKKRTYNSAKKYSLIATLFVCGLLFVSVIKKPRIAPGALVFSFAAIATDDSYLACR